MPTERDPWTHRDNSSSDSCLSNSQFDECSSSTSSFETMSTDESQYESVDEEDENSVTSLEDYPEPIFSSVLDLNRHIVRALILLEDDSVRAALSSLDSSEEISETVFRLTDESQLHDEILQCVRTLSMGRHGIESEIFRCLANIVMERAVRTNRFSYIWLFQNAINAFFDIHYAAISRLDESNDLILESATFSGSEASEEDEEGEEEVDERDRRNPHEEFSSDESAYSHCFDYEIELGSDGESISDTDSDVGFWDDFDSDFEYGSGSDDDDFGLNASSVLVENCHVLQEKVFYQWLKPHYELQWYDIVDFIVENDAQTLYGPAEVDDNLSKPFSLFLEACEVQLMEDSEFAF